MAAYVTEDYADFAVTTAKGIVVEETRRLETEIADELVALLETWTERVAARINARMEAVGIEQVLEIEVEWDPLTPTFTFRGHTNIGASDDE